MKRATIATAQTLERLERYVNEFWFSDDYRIDPLTLVITNAGACSVKLANLNDRYKVVPYKTGYRFVHEVA